jgi:polysaccharide pyruvyl transferase WcaK-like protein
MAIVREVLSELGLKAEFLIMSMRDGTAHYLDPSEAAVFITDTRSLFLPGGCWSVFGRQDCVLDIGAGDSFTDIYAFRRFFFIWFSKMLALGRGTPLLLSPQTIGPFSKTPHKQLAGIAMSGAKAVIARDRASLDAIKELAPKARRLLSVDVAFALPYEDNSALRGGEKLRVGVNVSGLLFNEAQSGSNRFGLEANYAELMRRWIAELASRPGVEVHLLTHVVEPDGQWEDDGRVADALAAEFPSVVRVPDFAGPCEAKSYISGLDFLVAGRMHACIAAVSSGTPVAPVAYSRKFSGLFAMLDYDWLVPVTGLGTEAALAYLNDCLERRAEMAADIAEGMKNVKALLDVYRDELRRFLTEAASAI